MPLTLTNRRAAVLLTSFRRNFVASSESVFAFHDYLFLNTQSMPGNSMKPGKRIIRKKTTKKKNGQMRSDKGRSQDVGTFHHRARREVMVGEDAPTHDKPNRYIKEAGKVVNFGGEIKASGCFGRTEKKELIRMVEKIGSAKEEKNSENRIISIKSTKDGFLVYTSKPQLAVAIGKKLHRARKGGELTITWSHFDLPVRVVWCADAE